MRGTRAALALVVCLGLAAAVYAADDGRTTGPSLSDVMKDPDRTVGFVRKIVSVPGGSDRICQVWVPLNYTTARKWPVILYLHGVGECGTSGEEVLAQGLPKEIQRRDGRFDFIVVMPQCWNSQFGWRGAPLDVAMGALYGALKEYACDESRVYLTGLAMGGHGAYRLAMKYPNMFAAVVPVSGGGDATRAAEIAHLPVWIWHGADDQTVPVDGARKMAEALRKAGADDLKYTELPGVGQNAWDKAYAGDDLWTWLRGHRLSKERVDQRKEADDQQRQQSETADSKNPKKMQKMNGKMSPMDGKMTPMDGKMHSMERGKFKPIRKTGSP